MKVCYCYEENFFSILFHMNFIRNLNIGPTLPSKMSLTKHLLVAMDVEVLFEFGHSFSDVTR